MLMLCLTLSFLLRLHRPDQPVQWWPKKESLGMASAATLVVVAPRWRSFPLKLDCCRSVYPAFGMLVSTGLLSVGVVQPAFGMPVICALGGGG